MRGDDEVPPGRPAQSCLAHQTGNAVLPDGYPFGLKLRVHSRVP